MLQALKDFPLLAAKLAERKEDEQGTHQSSTAVAKPFRSYVDQYIEEIRDGAAGNNERVVSALNFWKDKRDKKLYSTLPLIAQDFLAAPASQAYVERLFSVCGLMTSGRRNRMNESLNMRVWLKLNNDFLTDIRI